MNPLSKENNRIAKILLKLKSRVLISNLPDGDKKSNIIHAEFELAKLSVDILMYKTG